MKKYLKVKRTLDFFFALIMLLALSPIFLIVCILIKVIDGEDIFFKQRRPGKDCKIFTIYKFKTMINAQIKKGKSLTDMERITKLGAFLRKTSLDELPQLINILKGDMSFIGPRPLLVRYLDHYNDFQMRRHEILPGISGLAQVNGRNAVTWQQRFKLDVYYVDNVSLLLDIKILIKTIGNVLSKKDINNSADDTMPFFDEI